MAMHYSLFFFNATHFQRGVHWDWDHMRCKKKTAQAEGFYFHTGACKGIYSTVSNSVIRVVGIK